MKKQLELSVDQAKDMLGKDTALDALIRANFTPKELCLNIMDQIDSLQAALDYNGETLEHFEWRTERDSKGQKADKKREAICLALNEGKKLKMGETWYYPLMRKPVAGSGSSFSYHDYRCASVDSVVGARHSVNTSEKAIYMGKQFPEILTDCLSPDN